jgi:hypothetical protein
MNSTVGGLGGRSVPPAPTGWTSQRFSAAFVLSLGFLALVTAGLVAGAAWAFTDGEPGAGVLLGLGAVYIGHLVGFGLRVGRSSARRAGRPPTLAAAPDGGEGVRFAYSASTYYWFTAVLLLTELGLLAAVLVAAASAMALGIASAVVVAAMAAAIGWFLVTMLRLAPGGVLLSPVGVHHRSLTFAHFVPWHTTVRVGADWLNTPIILVRAAPSEDTRIHRYTGRFGTAELRHLPFMVIRAYWLATDPATVYHAMSFYHAHPDLRAELQNHSALDRITGGRAV